MFQSNMEFVDGHFGPSHHMDFYSIDPKLALLLYIDIDIDIESI